MFPTERKNSILDQTAPVAGLRNRKVPCLCLSLLAGAGILIAVVAPCKADWQMVDSSGSVSCSGTNVIDNGSYQTYSAAACDASWNAGPQGVTVSGAGNSQIDGRNTHGSVYLATAAAEWSTRSWAHFNWNGPAGYPDGPENFHFHISLSLGGTAENSGQAGGGGQCNALASASGGVSLSSQSADGGGIDVSGHAALNGNASGSSYSYDTYDVSGDPGSGGHTDHGSSGPGESWFSATQPGAGAWFGVSLDEDYVINTQTPPQVELSASLGSSTSGSISAPDFTNGDWAGTMARSSASGSASLTLGNTN